MSKKKTKKKEDPASSSSKKILGTKDRHNERSTSLMHSWVNAYEP